MMAEIGPSPRKAVKGFSPYVPGLSPEEIKEKYGLKRVIKLASNESFCGPSPGAVKEVKKELKRMNIYPMTEPHKLKSLIASKTLKKPENIILGNGADELIELICKTYLEAEDNIVVSEKSFVRFKMGAFLMNSQVIETPVNNLRIDLKKMLKKVNEKTKIIFVDNPCNPLGTFVNNQEMEEFFKGISEKKNPPLVVFDEAYYEYAKSPGYSSALKFMNVFPGLMTLRTFSKIYGLAGVRIGYGIASSKVISLINRIRPPFNTSRLAQAAAAGALRDRDFVKKVSEKTEKEKKLLYRELEMAEIKYIPSETNFILLEFSFNAEELCAHLLKKGIIIRPLAGYGMPGHTRITVGKREENTALIEEIKKYKSHKKKKG